MSFRRKWNSASPRETWVESGIDNRKIADRRMIEPAVLNRARVNDAIAFGEFAAPQRKAEPAPASARHQ